MTFMVNKTIILLVLIGHIATHILVFSTLKTYSSGLFHDF